MRKREALAIKNQLDRLKLKEEVILSREDIERYLDGVFPAVQRKKARSI